MVSRRAKAPTVLFESLEARALLSTTVLSADTTVSDYTPTSGDSTIDLNGHTFTVTGTLKVTSGATLTICNSNPDLPGYALTDYLVVGDASDENLGIGSVLTIDGTGGVEFTVNSGTSIGVSTQAEGEIQGISGEVSAINFAIVDLGAVQIGGRDDPSYGWRSGKLSVSTSATVQADTLYADFNSEVLIDNSADNYEIAVSQVHVPGTMLLGTMPTYENGNVVTHGKATLTVIRNIDFMSAGLVVDEGLILQSAKIAGTGIIQADVSGASPVLLGDELYHSARAEFAVGNYDAGNDLMIIDGNLDLSAIGDYGTCETTQLTDDLTFDLTVSSDDWITTNMLCVTGATTVENSLNIMISNIQDTAANHTFTDSDDYTFLVSGIATGSFGTSNISGTSGLIVDWTTSVYGSTWEPSNMILSNQLDPLRPMFPPYPNAHVAPPGPLESIALFFYHLVHPERP